MRNIIIMVIAGGFLAFIGFLLSEKYVINNIDSLTAIDNKIKQILSNKKIKNGDLIFQTSRSSQSKAIQQATNSIYSHCGIIYQNNSDFFVYEATQPVKLTPLNIWIARGKNGHYVIKRLKNADQVLTKQTLAKMKAYGEQLNGRNYDIYFEWNDDRIYCSELIWKIYKRATGLEVGKLQRLKDFDLRGEDVKEKMNERYGNNIPLDEIVISPRAIFESDLLMTVK